MSTGTTTGTPIVSSSSSGTEMTSAQLAAKINDIDAQIATLTASPGGLVDIKTLDVSISNSQKINSLLQARGIYQKLLDAIPHEESFYYTLDGEEPA